MPRCNIYHLVNHFVNAHAGQEVTSKQVRDWVKENYGCELNIHRLAQYLSKHPKFEVARRTSILHYRVVDNIEVWMDSLKEL